METEQWEKLKSENERLKNFAYIVSHNLKSYSNNMKSIFSYLEEGNLEESEKVEMMAHLKEISFSLDDTLIQLERIVAVNYKPDLEKMELNLEKSLVKELLVFKKEIEQLGAKVEMKIPGHLIVKANPGYLSSVFYNFVSNALKYREKSRRLEIQIMAWESESEIILEIRDNGIGIDLNRFGDQVFGLFKTFYKKPDSKGLGLYMAKTQMEAMGGSVFVSSKPGEGSHFGARFPRN